MKEWRVIIVLLSIIVLFLAILGIKIINNTPEKQVEKIVEKYEESIEKEESNKKVNKGEFRFEDFFGEEEEKEISWIKSFIATPFGIIISILLIIIMMIGYTQLYIKLHISWKLVKIHLISIFVYIVATVLMIVPIDLLLFLVLPFVSLGAIGTFFVTAIMIEYQLFHALDTSFIFILLMFVPVIGMIILNIILGIRLANKFDRGILFKIALCILPHVFRPILGLIG